MRSAAGPMASKRKAAASLNDAITQQGLFCFGTSKAVPFTLEELDSFDP